MEASIAEILKKGGIGVLPTDTIYGLVGSALNKETVERIYKVRKRSPDKPLIILISSLIDLKKFGINLSVDEEKRLSKIWPNKVSVILKCEREDLEYLHRGTNSLAFRLPKDEVILTFLDEVGPLVAPSANPEGEKSAETIDEAREYFNDNVDFYVDGGRIFSPPSTLVRLDNGKLTVLRQGEINV